MNARWAPILKVVSLSIWGASGLVLIAGLTAQAQDPPAVFGELLVEGRVERTFSSADGTQLVELLLNSVTPAERESATMGVNLPTAGEVLYVVAGRERGILGRLRGDARLPNSGDLIRASVQAEAHGIWTTTGADWFKLVTEDDARRRGTPADRNFEPADARVRFRGLLCEAKLVGGQLGLEVKQVDRGSPAQEAGFQPGDVVVAIDGTPPSSAADLARAGASSKAVELTVIDINTGRQALVTVPPGATANASTQPAAEDLEDASAAIARALGVTLQANRNGQPKGVTVARVNRNSAGAEAGLEVGDTIVRVGNQPVSTVDEFARELPRRAGTVTIVVRDVRSGREVPVEVKALGTEADSRPTESRSGPAAAIEANGFGIAGEVTFFNAEAAVRVVRVLPNSPADRAGVQPGMILTTANGQPLLHPDDLQKLEQSGRGPVTMRGVNPATQREFSVELPR